MNVFSACWQRVRIDPMSGGLLVCLICSGSSLNVALFLFSSCVSCIASHKVLFVLYFCRQRILSGSEGVLSMLDKCVQILLQQVHAPALTAAVLLVSFFFFLLLSCLFAMCDFFFFVHTQCFHAICTVSPSFGNSLIVNLLGSLEYTLSELQKLGKKNARPVCFCCLFTFVFFFCHNHTLILFSRPQVPTSLKTRRCTYLLA